MEVFANILEEENRNVALEQLTSTRNQQKSTISIVIMSWTVFFFSVNDHLSKEVTISWIWYSLR